MSLLAQAPDVFQGTLQVFGQAFANVNIWSVVGAVVPALILLFLFYRHDTNPEPRTNIIITFVLGVLISLPIVLVGVALRPWLSMIPMVQPAFGGAEHPIPTAAAQGFLAAALPEEVFKFLVVWLYCSRTKAFDEPMDGLIYGVTASLGFATLENVLYGASNNWYVIIGRALTAVPMHAFLGAIMGYFIGQAKFKRGGFGGMLLGLLVSFILHGLYDFFLMVPLFATPEWNEANPELIIAFLLGALGVLIVSGIWAIILVVRLRSQQAPGSQGAA
jgi:RsiW-degrading membrane proteinase PrsW (M82 family)